MGLSFDFPEYKPGDIEKAADHERLIQAASRDLIGGGHSDELGHTVDEYLSDEVEIFQITSAGSYDSDWKQYKYPGKRIEAKIDSGTESYALLSSNPEEDLFDPLAFQDGTDGAHGPLSYAVGERVPTRIIGPHRVIVCAPCHWPRWAKVQTGFSNVDAAAVQTVSVKDCDKDGANVAGDAYNVITGIRANKATALFTDYVVAWEYVRRWHVDGGRDPVIITDCYDDPMNVVKWFAGAVADIPDGWELCDGNNDTIDLSARFIMCIDEDGQGDENEIGDTGGFSDHGGGVNDHADHPIGYAFDHIGGSTASDDPINNAVTEAADGHMHEIVVDAGEFAKEPAEHSSTDNRPKYYVLAAMQRVN